MKSIMKVLAAAAVLIGTVPAVAHAQRALPVGAYQILPGEGFAGGFDLTTVTFDVEEGGWTILMAGSLVAKSTLKFEGADIVMITDLEGEMMCPGTAKYQVKKTDKGHTLKPLEDPCPERGEIISTLLLVKRG